MESVDEILMDHLFTLDSFLSANGYVNTRTPDQFENMNVEQFGRYIQNSYQQNEISSIDGIVVTDARNYLSGIYSSEDKTKKIFVYFGVVESQCVQNFLKYLCMIPDCMNAILVTDKDLSSTSRKELQRVSCNDNTEDVYTIVNFTDKTFIDVTANVMSPEVLGIYSGKEVVSEFESSRKVNSQKFPKIIVDDPLCLFHMCKIGDIIKLQRDVDVDGMLKTQIVYRTVVGLPYLRKGSSKR